MKIEAPGDFKRYITLYLFGKVNQESTPGIMINLSAWMYMRRHLSGWRLWTLNILLGTEIEHHGIDYKVEAKTLYRRIMTDRNEEKDPLDLTIEEYRRDIVIAEKERDDLKRKLEITQFCERLRVAWERRPEKTLDWLTVMASDLLKHLRELSDEELITAIEKLCSEGEK